MDCRRSIAMVIDGKLVVSFLVKSYACRIQNINVSRSRSVVGRDVELLLRYQVSLEQ